jgi:peptidoglycan/LPS O-acetylase OafA/YrhL
MMTAGKRRFFGELESLRGVAALTVVLFHIFGVKSPGPGTFDHPDFTAVANLIATTLFSGTGAVTVFFVLSGFVLGESLHRERELNAQSYLEFIIKRGFRLLPAAWASIALAIALYAIRNVPIRWDLLGPALTLQEQALPIFNGPLWSLNVEMWASVVFPLLVFANRLISGPFQIVILAVLMWMSNSGGFPLWMVFFFCFQLGLMVGTVFIPAIVRMPDRVAFALFVLAVLAVLLPTNLSMLGFITTRDHTHIEGLGAAFIVGYILAPQGAWLSRALNVRPLRFLGRISYSLYVFHLPLTAWIETWTWDHVISQPYLAAQIVCILTVVPVCLVAGALGYYLIEAPCLRLGRHIAKIPRPRMTATVAPAE